MLLIDCFSNNVITDADSYGPCAELADINTDKVFFHYQASLSFK